MASLARHEPQDVRASAAQSSPNGPPAPQQPGESKDTYGGHADTAEQLEVHIFDAEAWTPDAEGESAMIARLGEVEQKRVRRFRFDIDRLRSLSGRLMLHWFVACAVDGRGRAGTVRLDRTKEGKPYLVRDSTSFAPAAGFNMNVSHHGRWVAGSWSSKYLVGVDVMKYERPRGCKSIPDFFNTMKDSFAAEEWRHIKSGASESTQLVHFYRHWALKESYIKAVGVGLNFRDLSRISFSFPDDDIEISDQGSEILMSIDGVPKPQWRFRIVEPDPEHCIVIGLAPLSEASAAYQTVIGVSTGSPDVAVAPPATLWCQVHQIGAIEEIL